MKARIAPAVKVPRKPTPADKVPLRVPAPTLDDHLAIMTRAVFAAGLSWSAIDVRWHAFVTAFSQFEIHAVAAYGDFDVERLMVTPGIIHSRKKIEGSVRNARTLLQLAGGFPSISAYVERFETYAQTLADVRERFAFVGDLSCYYWLFRTGQRVPPFERWIETQKADHPRMREMILAGREAGTSTETESY